MFSQLTKKQKKMAGQIGIGATLFVLGLVFRETNIVSLVLFVGAYIVLGKDVLKKACINIQNKQIFDENFLMSIASIGAFLLGEYSEAVAVLLFYQIGEWFQSVAVDHSRNSIAELMDIRPDYANIQQGDVLVQVDPYDIKKEDVILVQPGEKIPLDGIVIEGQSVLDTSALTGESLPRNVNIGDEVVSGCINTSGLLHIKVTKEFDESTVSKILDMVENASNRKSQSEDFITKFARYYTPIVCGLALVLGIIPSIITKEPSIWIYRALTFLVISCPCALVISVPLSFFGGIGGASKRGILVKGSNFLEVLSKVKVIVMDKTGTLTQGKFSVTGLYPMNCTKEELLELAATMEAYSTHPIGQCIKEAYGKKIETNHLKNLQEIAGKGISAQLHGHSILLGNKALMDDYQIAFDPILADGTFVYVAADQKALGIIVVADTIKSGSQNLVQQLKEQGIEKIIMMTGDNAQVASSVAQELGIDQVYSSLLPNEKLERLEQVMNQNDDLVAFVGDGINDAPVLMRADVGIAMGALGSDAAIEAADVVLMDDQPEKIGTAISISKKTLRIVYQNIIFAIGVKVFVLILGALGLANMWAAVFADVGVAFLAILNALRCMR